MEKPNISLQFEKLMPSVTAKCEILACGQKVAYAVIWNKGHGRRELCSGHKKELEKQPDLLGTWFQLGPYRSTQD
jgi:hypothetical protein